MLPVSTLKGIKVYNLSLGKTLPQWIEDAQSKKTSLKYNVDYRNRIELIQDFNFNTASLKIKVSNDGKHVISTGTYPPQYKIFDIDQLGVKVERHFDAEALQIEMLTDDISKLAILRNDRSVEFHIKSGNYFKTRLPRVF